MSDNNQGTAAYVFVDAPAGDEDESCYEQQSPTYPYAYKAWAWLLERTLRRTFILKYFNTDAGLAALASRTGAYRLSRWTNFKINNGKSRFSMTPFSPSLVSAYDHDGALASGSTGTFPTGAINKTTGEVVTAAESTDYGIPSLGYAIETLLQNTSFLAPDWAPPESFRFESSMVETTSGTGSGSVSASGYGLIGFTPIVPEWNWTTTRTYTPPTLPSHPFFRLLTDMRIDDPPQTVEVADSEGRTRRVTLAKTVPAIKDSAGLTTYKGVKVLAQGYSGVNTNEWLAFAANPDMRSDGTFQGSGKYHDATGTATDAMDVVGVLPGKFPRSNGSPIYTSVNDALAHVQPDIDWNGQPTWWHANGFPQGLDSIVSGKLRAQVKALSVTQPAIPPCFPYLYKEGFPEDGHDCFGSHWYYVVHERVYFSDPSSFKGCWPCDTLELAATPYCMSRMLDALTKTVFAVPHLFFGITSATTRTTASASTEDQSSPMPAPTTTTTRTTKEGTIVTGDTDLLTCDLSSRSNEGDSIDETESFEVAITGDDPSYQKSSTRRTVTRQTTLTGPVALRSTSATTASTVTTETGGSPFGELPSSADPADVDLMFPPWIRTWISSAELFLAYDVTLWEGDPEETTGTVMWHLENVGSLLELNVIRGTYTGSGSGQRTTRSAKGVVSLGTMNLETGKFPDIDLVDLRSECDPSGGSGNSPNNSHHTSTVTTGTNSEGPVNGQWIKDSEETTTTTVEPDADYVRKSRLFVVVTWNFDNKDASPFG